GEDLVFARDDVGGHAYGDGYAILYQRVPSLTDAENMPIAQCDIGLINPRIVQDHHVGDDGIRNAIFAEALTVLAHPVANDLAATKRNFLTVIGVVVFNLC